MGFTQQKHSRKKRSRKQKARRTGSRAQAQGQRASIEHHPALPADPVFDLFLAQQEQTHNQTIAEVKPINPEAAIVRSISLIHRTAWHRCEHIFLSPGVTTMLDEIYHDPEPYGLSERLSCHLPSPAWIKIEESNFTPFYEYLGLKVRGIFILNVFTPDNLALLKKQPFARSLNPTLDRAFSHLRNYVTVQLIGTLGECLFKLEFEQSAQFWRIAGEHRCPYHTCLAVAGRRQQLCPRCEMALDLFSRWFPICMLALQGRFRQIEQESSPKAAAKLGKGAGETPSPAFRVVRTIDVSVRPARKTGEEEATGSSVVSPRGSWVEKARAIDPNLVKKEERDVPERTRTLSLPRYAKCIKKHGTNEVTVKAHKRSIPLLNVPRATRAKAKRYDTREEK